MNTEVGRVGEKIVDHLIWLSERLASGGLVREDVYCVGADDDACRHLFITDPAEVVRVARAHGGRAYLLGDAVKHTRV